MSPRSKFYTVYCLYSKANNSKTYVGITCNCKKRLTQHNHGKKSGAKTTRAHRPWAYLFQIKGRLSYKEAAQLEYAWKHKRRGGPGISGRIHTLQYILTLKQLTKKGDPFYADKLSIYSTLDQKTLIKHGSDRWPMFSVSRI